MASENLSTIDEQSSLSESEESIIFEEDKIIVEVELVEPLNKYPEKATPLAAGFDVRANQRKDGRPWFIKPFDSKKIFTGLKIRMPEGIYGEIFLRSSVSLNKCLALRSTAIIDNDFISEIILNVHNTSGTLRSILGGERFAQIIFKKSLPIKLVPSYTPFEICNRQKSIPHKGFGSTGKF